MGGGALLYPKPMGLPKVRLVPRTFPQQMSHEFVAFDKQLLTIKPDTFSLDHLFVNFPYIVFPISVFSISVSFISVFLIYRSSYISLAPHYTTL